MNTGLIAIGIVCAAAASLAPHRASAQAQQQELYAVCRQEAAVKNIGGDAYGVFLDECMMRPAPTPSASPTSQQRFASCQSQARATAGRGEAYGKALDQCMSAPAASGAPSSPGMTYAECRSQAIAQGMTGDRLANFINSCVAR